MTIHILYLLNCRRDLHHFIWDCPVKNLVDGLVDIQQLTYLKNNGARSILGDARSKDTQTMMNLKIKYRESFRPFAPSVLEEKAPEYFDTEKSSPYMLLVAKVREERCLPQPSADGMEMLERLKVERSDIPAITHLDYSARLQTVRKSHKLQSNEPPLGKVVFYVSWYDVGKAALEGLTGIKEVKRGFRGFREINTVIYDPRIITIDEMVSALKEARTYLGMANRQLKQ